MKIFKEIMVHILFLTIITFFLGDNRNHSYDSREWSSPFVHRKKIIGKVEIKYLPEFIKIN
ncbi:S26 family signal peptidase [Alkaliphilus sp. B6464]|uniref:S26 family signal peptidase n=1 Tax=Alkaliphilus sp. B6464 TaxID=2731219 RepID=UPI003FA48AEB